MNCGIVIGSYGMPGVVELGIAVARHTCGGDVPILISDDCTPDCRGAARIKTIPDRWPGVELVVTETNLGHAPGDTRAFRNGLLWAKRIGLDYLAKFSQRFIPLRPNWLQLSAADLKASGLAYASQRAVHLHMGFPMRTEAVLMDVRRCTESEGFMGKLDPPGGKIPTSAEHWICAAANEFLGKMHRWRLFSPDRFHRMNTVVWHNANASDDFHSGDEYRELAKRYGIQLTEHDRFCGWHIIHALDSSASSYHML